MPVVLPGDRVLQSADFKYINQGAFGQVWQTPDNSVVKVQPYEGVGLPEEVIAARGLDHEHLVRLHSYTIDAEQCRDPSVPKNNVLGRIAIEMELCVNGSLRTLLENVRPHLLPSEASQIVTQVAEGLYYIHHKKGLVHRDVKPENILFDEKWSAKLADFGLVVPAYKKGRPPTDISGTLVYMAPEQLDGESTANSDQYALAVLAYELVTGGLPFTTFKEGTQGRQEIENAHRYALPPTFAEMTRRTGRFLDAPGMSRVEAVLKKALAKDQYERYPSVMAFAEAFEEALADVHDPLPERCEAVERRREAANYAQKARDTRPNSTLNAITYYEKALELDSESIDVRYKLAMLWDELGYKKQANALFESILAKHERIGEDFVAKARVCWRFGRIDEAITRFEEGLERKDGRLSAALGLAEFGKALEALGDSLQNTSILRARAYYDKAFVCYDKAHVPKGSMRSVVNKRVRVSSLGRSLALSTMAAIVF